jgi:hypothetical protein
MLFGVVRIENLVFFEILDLALIVNLFDEFVVLNGQEDYCLRHYGLVQYLGTLLFFLFLFTFLKLTQHEHVVGVLVSAGEPVQEIPTVLAVVLC